MVWFGHLYHTGKFAFFVPSIFAMHTDLKSSSTTCGEEPKNSQTGQIQCVECKASSTAPLTKNQKKAFPEIEQSGATVVGKGKAPYTGGTKIPPTKVEIIRKK
ncbi:hypothetical protein [Geobacillus kaustophilus]|uniref:hypothetical protein n=1 Tax=Geobacillus kaustophilus TaxID=1462 RepID=UPI0018CCD694|nr:hypothetical protein [Geobacillus kaustophilus]